MKKISNNDCWLMGYTTVRPENMVVESLPIPPNPVRPSVQYSNSEAVDDLTKKLSTILNNTKKINKKKVSTNSYVDNANDIKESNNDSKLLSQYHYSTYLNNTSVNSRSEVGGRPTSSLADRLSKKEGRIRNNLLGKRVDFCARTVITPDTSIKPNEFRIPLKIAMTLTKPIYVNHKNIKELSVLVKNGKDKYPGANFIFKEIKGKTVKIELRYGNARQESKLKIGDIVERHLQDGDLILVNRQPSLHKLSMMGHKAVISKNPLINSFGLNPNVTTPYNADFDGDEMNIHMPQEIQSSMELEKLTFVDEQLITPRDSSPIISATQDTMIGSYTITDNNVKINWKDVMEIISLCEIKNKSVAYKEFYTGKEIISLIIPKNITVKNKDLEIINGQLLKGSMDKATLKPEKKNNLVHTVWREYNPNKASNFLNNVQKIADYYNAYSGFSVSLEDIEVNKDIKDQIIKFIESKKLQVKYLTTEAENNSEIINIVDTEAKIQNALLETQTYLSTLIMNTLSKNSGYYVMVKSGAKGSDVNIFQMAGCVGLQNINGGRIEQKVNGRSLFFYAKHDTSAEATGFVENPYYDGCKFGQFNIHTISGRIGIVEKVISTADTGYKQRKLIKFMEDIVVKNDLTVRDAKNYILQFNYADNCINPIELYDNSIYTLDKNDNELKKIYLYDKSPEALEHFNEFILLRNKLRRTYNKFNYSKFNSTCQLAFDIESLINISINKFKFDEKINPKYVFTKLKEITNYENTQALAISEEELKDKNSFKVKDEQLIKSLMKYCIYQSLTPKLLEEKKVSKKSFDYIIKSIIHKYNKNIISIGEAVGIISAQSCGEIQTQMKLNTFHSAGLAGTSGIERIEEIINIKPTIKTPMMSLFFDGLNENEINEITKTIKYTIFKNIIEKIEIYYEPKYNDKDSFYKLDDIGLPYKDEKKSNTKCQDTFDKLPWLIRIKIDNKKLLFNSLNLIEVRNILCKRWKNRNLKRGDIIGIKNKNKLINQCAIACTENSKKEDKYIHVRFAMKMSSINSAIKFSEYISSMIIKGMNGITQIIGNKHNEIQINKFNKDGDVIKKKMYTINTFGINMSDACYLKGVDFSKTIINDVITVYNYYGIEAARNLIIRELDNAYGGKISYNHYSIIADIMTSRGILIKIYRADMPKLNVDVLSHASFEETVPVLINGAVLEKTDDMSCVSSRIMAGLNIKNGTGLVNSCIDIDLLTRSEKVKLNNIITKGIFKQNSLIQDIIMNKNIKSNNIFIPF